MTLWLSICYLNWNIWPVKSSSLDHLFQNANSMFLCKAKCLNQGLPQGSVISSLYNMCINYGPLPPPKARGVYLALFDEDTCMYATYLKEWFEDRTIFVFSGIYVCPVLRPFNIRGCIATDRCWFLCCVVIYSLVLTVDVCPSFGW
jgi:hypothetical protein